MGPIFAIPIILTVALFALILVFHEFGHFVLAKLWRIPVYEFALGFGRPILLSFKWRGTQYSLRPIPFGGFVRIAGMEPDEDVPNGFDKKSIPARLGVIAAGSAMNFVLAIIIFWIVGLAFGQIVGHTSRIQRVLPGTIAASAGIQAGDVLVYAEPAPVGKRPAEVKPAAPPLHQMKLETLREVIRGRPDTAVRIVVRRHDSYLAFHLIPQAEQEQRLEPSSGGKNRVVTDTVGKIGVVFADLTKRQGFFQAVGDGFVQVYVTTRVLVVAIALTLIGKLPPAVGGPVQIGDIMANAFEVGWQPFLMWSALISINVGFLNLLPVPALDGSRLVFIIIEGIRRRPIDRRKEAIVHLIGFALLLLLLVIVTFNDILMLVERHFG